MRLDAVGWQPHCLCGEARFDSGQARSMCRLIPDFDRHKRRGKARRPHGKKSFGLSACDADLTSSLLVAAEHHH